MPKRILVTGVAGQIGKHLGKFLRMRGYFVAGLDLLEPDESSCDEFHRLDITAPGDELKRCLVQGSFDCVIHLAAIVAPTEVTDHGVMSANVWGTYNLVSATAAAGAPRFIYMSSESTLGFAFAHRKLAPLSIPIDEEHPLRAHDVYGLSKLLGEQVCQSLHHASIATVFSLRPPWVWIPEKLDRYDDLVRRPAEWAHGLWAYIAIDDLCTVVERAVEIDAEGYHAFFVAADDNGTSRPSLSLLREFYDYDGPVSEDFGDFDSVISSAAARRFFGWRPSWHWRDWLQRERQRAEREVMNYGA